MDRGHVLEIECGKRMVTLDTLQTLAKGFDISMSALLKGVAELRPSHSWLMRFAHSTPLSLTLRVAQPPQQAKTRACQGPRSGQAPRLRARLHPTVRQPRTSGFDLGLCFLLDHGKSCVRDAR
jgi:transcriptional regulator with XRE-family HTH domain